MAAAVAKVMPGKTSNSCSLIKGVVKSTLSAVKGGELNGKVTAARLLQLWALATPSILFTNGDRAGELHRQIALQLVDRVLETVTDKPRTLHIRAKHWAETISAQQQQQQQKRQLPSQPVQPVHSKQQCQQ